MFTTLASAYRWADHLTQSLPDNEVRESHNVTQCNTLKTALRAKGGTAGWTQSRSPRVSCALSHGGQGSGMGVGHAVSPASRRSEFKLKCGFYSTHITSAPPQSRKITAQTIVKSGTLYIHMSNHSPVYLKLHVHNIPQLKKKILNVNFPYLYSAQCSRNITNSSWTGNVLQSTLETLI